MKRILIFADGTWQSPRKTYPTNVLRMARAVKPVDSIGNDQVVFYDWGVGTDRKKFSGGLSGVGINKNIQDCYRFIVQNYDPNDELYFFGFSRGAYTVRSLGGFIRNCGILKRKHANRIHEAFDLYRAREASTHPNSPKPKAFRKRYAVADKSRIRFIGVWDTVGALGIPIPFLGALGDERYLFHDVEPSSIVDVARQALAIDENREDFQPAIWVEKAGLDLLQVWFAGAHSDVGGGYKTRGLSDIAIKWLLDEARAAGLEMETHLTSSIAPKPSDRLHNERKGIYKLRKEFNRAKDKDFHDRVPLKKDAVIHASVRARWNQVASYKKSKAVRAFLALHGGSWSSVSLVP